MDGAPFRAGVSHLSAGRDGPAEDKAFPGRKTLLSQRLFWPLSGLFLDLAGPRRYIAPEN
jgi:hypothetical protein